jgi:hypothetical protein
MPSMEEEPLVLPHGSGRYVANDSLSSRGSDSGSGTLSPTSPIPLQYAAFLDWQEHEKRKFHNALPPAMRSRRQRGALYLAMITLMGIGALLSAFKYLAPGDYDGRPSRRADGPARPPYFLEKYIQKEAGPGTFPLDLHSVLPSDVCSICDCHATPAFYSPAKNFMDELLPRPLSKHVYPSADSIDTNEFMRQALLDIYCARQHLDPYQALKLLRRTRNLEELMSWSLTGLDFGKPTIYLTTVTSSDGKAGSLRPQYFRRSGRAIRSWIAQQTADAQEQHPGWQVAWIVAEDEHDIDPLVVRTLRRTGIAYVYFAYGKTQSWGNAQKNAVMQVVYALSRPDAFGGLFGPGPVYGLDDDNKIQPDLMNMLVKVERIGVLGVGNLGPDMWERPVVNELGEVIESESLWNGRKYPFDYGGFCFNSTLLGTVVSGPMFWKHNDFAGESEFIDQIVGSIRDLEPLCGRQQNQECHFVWHNEPLLELEKMTDDEEIAYVRKFGADHLFEQLGLQAVEYEAAKLNTYEPPIPD